MTVVILAIHSKPSAFHKLALYWPELARFFLETVRSQRQGWQFRVLLSPLSLVEITQ